jgi:DGQHR domain-containing protein
MSNSTITLKALPVKQPIGEFYATSIAAKDLVRISFSDVRRLAEDPRDFERYLGIQRPVSMTRVREIKRYIQGKDATFPTAVIIAIDERCAEYDAKTGELTLSPYIPDKDSDEEAIPMDRVARVIDGQHRIAAFMDEDKNWAFQEFEDKMTFDLNLAVFVGADISEQANIFATVNLAQTKVNRSLVYDLTELSKTRSPHRTCHNIAVILDREKRSPLFHRIKRLGVATPGRQHEPLTQAVFVESLVKFLSLDPLDDRRVLLDRKKLPFPSEEELMKCPFRLLFIEDKELDIAQILFNYFTAVRERWPNSWEALGKASNLLPKSNAFKALMKFLREDVYPSLAQGNFRRVPTTAQFARFFEPLKIADKDFTTSNFAPGSSGQSAFLKMLRQQITIRDMIEG